MVKRAVEERDAGPLVDWYNIKDRFEDLLDALIAQVHPNAERCEPIDGRGGDDGADCYVLDGGREIIYQYKYFPDGFDGKHSKRRAQIENENPKKLGSLNQAIKKYPNMDEWVLVAPCKPTKPGWAYIQSLREKFPDITISFVDRAQLNGPRWCAGHQDVVKAICSRDELLEKAVILRNEQAVLADPIRDTVARAVAFQKVLSDVDPYYNAYVAQSQAGIQIGLGPKTPAAAKASPIRLTVSGLRSDPELQAFDRYVRYGSLTDVRLSARNIASIRGTVWLQDLEDLDELVFPGSQLRSRTSLRLVLWSGDTRLTAVTSPISRASRGSHGITVEHTVHEALTLVWQLPADGTTAAELTAQFAGACGLPVPVARVVYRLMQLWREADRVQLFFDDIGVGEVGMDFSEFGGTDFAEHGALMSELLDDLEMLQRTAETYFPVPAEITAVQRAQMRTARMALEGKVAYDPVNNCATATFEPELATDGDEERLASLLRGEPSMLLWSGTSWVVLVGGQELTIRESFALLFRSVRLEDADRVRAELAAGQKARVKFTSTDGEHVIVYCPGRVATNQPLSPQPWGLRGIDELPGVSAVTELASGGAENA